MKKCFVFETLSSVKDLKAERKEGLMTLSGIFGVCGVRNNNSRVYEKKNYESCVKVLKQRIAENGGIAGELEHPDNMNINLENISHKIIDININEQGVVTGTIQLLDTPKGKIAQAIIEGGLSLFVSSRAQGKIDQAGQVTLETLSTYDLVGSPGFSEAKMHLNENQQGEAMDNFLIVTECDTKTEGSTEETPEEKELGKGAPYLDELDTVVSLKRELTLLKAELAQLKGTQEVIPTAVERWVKEEYSPVVESWIKEEVMKSLSNDTEKAIGRQLSEAIKEAKEEVYSTMAESVEKWITEEYSPELQNWITEEYSPVVENWCKSELATGIQNWITESFTGEVDQWINEHVIPAVLEKAEAKSKELVSESVVAGPSKLDNISKTIAMLEQAELPKPKAGRVVKETAEPFYIANMPESYRPMYQLASTELKESIARKAKIYDFTKEGSVERFWESVDFNTIVTNPITEGLEAIKDQYERSIVESFRRSRLNRFNR